MGVPIPTYEINEGYSADTPIPEWDWEEIVRWGINYQQQERKDHDEKGAFTELAGSDACLALGHSAPDGGWGEWDYEDDDHVYGFDGDLMCLGTRYGVACTYCEGECQANLDDVTRDEFWALPGVRGRSTR